MPDSKDDEVFFLLWLRHFPKKMGEDDQESRGGIMVNGVHREVPRPKPEGPQAPRVLAAGLSEGLHFTMIHPRLFHRFSFFWHPELE